MSACLSLQTIQDSEVLCVGLEATEVGHETAQYLLSFVAKGRMAYVVRQCCRLTQLGVSANSQRDALSDLGDLQGMSEPGAKKVRLANPEHLRLSTKAAKG